MVLIGEMSIQFFIFCSSTGSVYNVRSAKAHELLMNA